MRPGTIVALLGVLWIAACAPAPEQSQQATADENALDALVDDESVAYSSGDSSLLDRLYTPDVVLMPPDEPLVQGLDAAKEWMDTTRDQLDAIDLHYTAHENRLFGDIATQKLDFQLTVMATDDSEPTVFDGKGLHICRRQDDGSWKIAYAVWNWNQPVAETEPEAEAEASESESPEPEMETPGPETGPPEPDM